MSSGSEPTRSDITGPSARVRPDHQPGSNDPGRKVKPQKAMPSGDECDDSISCTSPGRARNTEPGVTSYKALPELKRPSPEYARQTSWKEWVCQ